MTDDTKDTVIPEAEAVPGAADDEGSIPDENKKEPPPPSIEEQLRARIKAAVTGEIRRLEQLAEQRSVEGNDEAHCHAIESIASIKARAEVYCIQVEMAAKTAAMASVIGGMARGGGQAQAGDAPAGGHGGLDPELLKRVARPGGGEGIPVGTDGRPEVGKGDQSEAE